MQKWSQAQHQKFRETMRLRKLERTMGMEVSRGAGNSFRAKPTIRRNSEQSLKYDNADWSKTNEELANEMNVSVNAVAVARRRRLGAKKRKYTRKVTVAVTPSIPSPAPTETPSVSALDNVSRSLLLIQVATILDKMSITEATQVVPLLMQHMAASRR